MEFDSTAYLDRIGLAAAPSVDAEGLHALQVTQMRAITFENIDPLLGRVPDLAFDALWAKLVEGGRGGYCFELNGLFSRALAVFGFDARPLLARVRSGNPTGGARSHQAFIVTLAGAEWLVDCGFGGPGPVGPIALGTEAEQRVHGVVFRMRNDASTGEDVLERRRADGWFSLYSFDRIPVAPADYLAANFVSARWEHSPFPNNLMITRPTAEGRISLRNLDLRRIGAEGEDVSAVDTLPALAETLRGPFGLALDDETVLAVWDRLTAHQPERHR